MDVEEFLLVRSALREFAERWRPGGAEVKDGQRAAAQRALEGLGLAALRAPGERPGDLPAATAQECALLAEEWGAAPHTSSFLGTGLLAPELLRLAGLPAAPGAPADTVALGPGLGFPAQADETFTAWDCEGAEAALILRPDGTLHRASLGKEAPTVDLLRRVRTVDATRAEPVGRLSAVQVTAWQAWALTLCASELAGTARTFVDGAAAYARDRVQYGSPIGTRQAVQHLLAEALVDAEASLGAARYAAWCLDRAEPAEALAAARTAKAEAGEGCLRAVQAGCQVYGGIAQTWEHPAHLSLRRVLADGTAFAGVDELLLLLADEPREPGEPGEPDGSIARPAPRTALKEADA
jgi:alkylation response protein AidB-like acyl-CoA dehydrogenase